MAHPKAEQESNVPLSSSVFKPRTFPSRTPLPNTEMLPTRDDVINGISDVSVSSHNSRPDWYKMVSTPPDFNSNSSRDPNSAATSCVPDCHPISSLDVVTNDVFGGSLSTTESEMVDVQATDTDVFYHILDFNEVFNFLPAEPVDKLGFGSNGTVFLIKSMVNSEQFAAKVFMFNYSDKNKSISKFKAFCREISVLQDLDHENIIKMIYPVTGPSYGVLFLEFCPGGDFHTHVLTLTGELAFKYFCQIMSAVGYMHSLRIVHRDIKLGNTLLKGDRAVLTDFGLSQKLSPESNLVHGCVGTRMYIAPEAMTEQSAIPLYYDGLKADSFSLGVYLWCLLKRQEPKYKTNKWLLDLERDVYLGISFDPILLECSRKLLVENPEKRWYVSDVINYFEKRVKGKKK